MESRRGKWREEVLVPMVILLVLCFTSMLLLLLSACASLSCGSKAIAWAPADTRSDCSTMDSNSQVLASKRRRRQLKAEGGPGSYPPRCMAKCGNCNPCFPVHVPVPPGTPVTTEYYPEAWRCKCGNRLFMP